MLLFFLYVMEEAGRKYVRDMPWPPAAECNMITNKQIQILTNEPLPNVYDMRTVC